MDCGQSSYLSRRPRFCDALLNENRPKTVPLVEIPEEAYALQCIRTFLIEDGNLHGLAILEQIEDIVTPYLDSLRQEILAIAIMLLIKKKRDFFMHSSNPQIKDIFGNCPFNTLLHLKDLATKLENELAQEQLDFIFSKSNNAKMWTDNEFQTKHLETLRNIKISPHFMIDLDKLDNKKEQEMNGDGQTSSFSMIYEGQAKASSSKVEEDNLKFDKNYLPLQYSKYVNKFPGLTCEEFCKSLVQSLTSSKSNEELQNELFETLGFDAFELILELLDNRVKIVEGLQTHKATQIVKNAKNFEKNGPNAILCDTVTIQSREEKQHAKQMRKLEKKVEKYKNNVVNDYEDQFDYLYEDVPDQSASLFMKSAQPQKHYPNVHDEQKEVQMKATVCGKLISIPLDAKKKNTNLYEEITIPPRKSAGPLDVKPKRNVSTMDPIGRMVFKDIESFNHIQSEVYPIAYHTNENMLICAPTGAGKTNIALLTIVQQIKNFIENDVLRLEKFKIVYVCPMKALAAEMAHNFTKKLMPLGINVRELTGDMQLTRKEIVETQMLVTTPEKWDVITRKGTTDGELTSLLKLLIIDEVHLLNSDRGPVIEALVARTLRQVVNSQNMIRIVGLSATLPNYMDVAHFLRVNPEIGLFYFDGRYRSVPLTQTFVGIKALKQNQIATDTDEVCFEKVVEFLRQGHQVMVFVHARNQTSKTANYLKETAQFKNVLNLFEPDKSFKAKKSSWNATNKSLANFLPYGLGIHHAGMLRKDRNEVERCFLDGAIKVLVCTATLAWGVNLPAHGVIIKGTKLYDSKKGAFVDLDILDVMQIFGRAGRPQFDSSGTGIIITSQDKMHFYLSALTNQVPIESKLLNALTDNLNAEIILGSVSNVQEAVEWMTFTYLYRRMRINPQVYGLLYSDIQNDPDLRENLLNFIHTAAKMLDKARMIRYIEKTGDLMPTNLGRTASYYYINFYTMEIFNERMNPSMTEAEIIAMMCEASEFQQIQVRQEELEDLDILWNEYCEFNVPGGPENVHGKVNILMQTYLSRGYIKSLSLASDMEYITQSAARIARSLFDISVHQNKAILASKCLMVAQMFEQQLWPFQTPLRQFKHLDLSAIDTVEKMNLKIYAIREMDDKQVGQAVRNFRMGPKIRACADYFPLVEVTSVIQPITRGVIRVKLQIKPDFRWNNTYHGKACESFWVWVEDPDNDYIYHTETCTITKAACMKQEPIDLVFTIPLMEPLPSQYLVRVSSDRWLQSVITHPLSFLDLKLPQSFTPHTDLLELQPLEVSALSNPLYEKLFSFSHFNPVQTQIFHCLYHTDNNILLGAPTGSGKTIAAEICIFRLFNNTPDLKVVYIAPLKALVRERVDDWRKKFSGDLKKNVVEITGDVTPSPQLIANADVIITTPEKWDGMSRGWQTRHFIRQVGLMIIDEIHLLGEDRGPVLEVIVSRTNFISDRTGRKLRIVGLSTAMANARDLATWLGIGEMGLYNFRPSVRPVPLEVHIQGFPGKHYCPRMMSMNRPAYQAIRQYAPDSPALVFCSSRKQTRLTAFDLITYLVTDSDPKQWLHCDEDNITLIISNVLDPDLKQFLAFGIGIHHAGLQERDRKTVEELFVNQKIQVLIATGTLAWGVNFPAHLVVIKGTEYFDGSIKRYVDMPITDVLQMMGRAGRPQFDTSGVACVFVHDIKKNFYKKFLYEPFPVESNLLQVLPDHVNAEVAAETVPTKCSLMEYLTWTYFFRRLLENPRYYNLPDVEPAQVNEYLSDLVDSVIQVLEDSNCLVVTRDEQNVLYESTFFGQIASFYYLSHKTMRHFQDNLKGNNSISDLLELLTQAHEYALFPVRHNEDKINVELAKILNYRTNSYDSPHVKVSILLQMFLGDLELPNQEYIVDLKSVLDQAMRILQAMIDISANNGWLSVTLRLISLMQMLTQGIWMYEPDILCLRHITKSTIHAISQEINRNSKLKECRATSLAGMRYACIQNEHALTSALINVLGTRNANDTIRTIKTLPWISCNLLVTKVDDSKNESVTYKLNDNKGKPIQLIANQEYEFSFQFIKKGKDDSVVLQSYRYQKKKDESWFMILGKTDDELVTIKRSALRHKTTVSMKIVAPSIRGSCIFNFYLLSDSYLGLDQQYEIPLHILGE